MSAWWSHLWNDPISRNPWSLAGAVLIGAMMFVPVMVAMGRDMFGRRKQETQMTEPVQDAVINPQAVPVAEGVDLGEEERWRQEGIPEADTEIRELPIAGRGAARVPAPFVSNVRIDCEHCGGRGYVPGINDLLQESLGLLGDAGDEVVRKFYGTLFRAHADLIVLFPGNPTQGDFGTDHKGAHQRELLLDALKALAALYEPSDPGKMERLDTALASFGRKHAAFVRPDGTIKGATLEEYAAVKEALFGTLIAVAAEHWRPEYSAAWSEAYDFAAGVMMAEQRRSGFSAPRFVRG